MTLQGASCSLWVGEQDLAGVQGSHLFTFRESSPMLSPTAYLPARDPTCPGFNMLLLGLYQFHLDDKTAYLVAWSGNLPLSEPENGAGSALTCTPVRQERGCVSTNLDLPLLSEDAPYRDSRA